MVVVNRKRFFLSTLVIFLVVFFSYASIGIYDYSVWIGAKKAIAVGGYPWQCGAFAVGTVTPGCVITSGSCTCSMCNALCNGSTQVIFSGQAICGTTFACLGPEVVATGLPIASSKQAILAGTSNLLTGNAVVATQSVAANRVEKLINIAKKSKDFIVAGFK